MVIDGKTILPVAKVADGFGGTKRASSPGEHTKDPHAVTASVRAASAAKPIGVVGISTEETRFVPCAQTTRLAVAAAIASGFGLMLGMLLGRRGKN